MTGVHLVVHGHFYQPPRENPWTEVVPVEPSAAPHHDWNERITEECYRPNGWARVVDDAGRVVDVVSTYEHLSFNVGPTLLSWLEAEQPDVYERILEADRAARRAIAQAYGHAILPLCNERDLRTQLRWGIADFVHRFGRRPEGMWLPETAVNEVVLACLAEEGIRFTILAPGQVEAVRPLAGTEDDWRDVDGHLDTSRPFRWEHPQHPGLHIELVVYDGSLSHDLAFAGVPSQALVARALAHARPGDDVLVCAATDGETFGHHHHFAERGVAYALTVEAARRGVATPRLADLIEEHPPTHQARVRTSAWSCVHGVARWMADCGCHTGGEPGWTQAWRSPLRHALDVLRDHVTDVTERAGTRMLKDPWAARDAYVEVLLGATPLDAFVAEHVTGDPVEALTLLEAQRHALLMYTSCGWFFNDLAGIETLQILRYAARCLDLLAELGEPGPEQRVLDILATARSNHPDEGDGLAIWERHVAPSRVDAGRVVAHLALVELLGDVSPGAGDGRARMRAGEDAAELGGHVVERGPHLVLDRGGLSVCAGEVTLTHRRTRRRSRHAYAAVHLGGLEVFGATRPLDVFVDVGADLDAVRRAVEHGERVTTLLREVVSRFGPREFGLESALPDAAGQIVARAAEDLVDRFAATFEQLHADHGSTFRALARAGYPLPRELRAPVEVALTRRFESLLAEAVVEGTPAAFVPAVSLARSARAEGISVGSPRTTALVARAVERAVTEAVAAATFEAIDVAVEVVDLAHQLDLSAPLQRSQELVFDALVAAGDRTDHPLSPLGAALDLAVGRLGEPS
jgi:hypothetical protein